MNNKYLMAIALLGAPFLFIGYLVEAENPSLVDSWFTGFWGFMYITGWMFSMIALLRENATGHGMWGKGLMWLILFTLFVANVSNIYQWVAPKNKPSFFFYIDLCWPISNLLMTFVAIAVLRVKKMQGWRKFVPLIVALWLPISIALILLMGKNNTSMMIGGVYSLVAWTLLAVCAGYPYPSQKMHSLRQAVPGG